MLQLNAPSRPGHNVIWKVLILDEFTQRILSTLIKVNELRENGVTVHFEREQIEDAPAIYFVQPTKVNIDQINLDIRKSLYHSYYLNFAGTIPRILLEELANHVVACNSHTKVNQVFDQYLEFISLESNLFTLNENNSFLTLFNSKSTEDKIDLFCDKIASNLFSVFVSLGKLPFIQCLKGGPSELIAIKLETKIRNHLLNYKNNLFPEKISKRSLIILADRTFDYCTPLLHCWTYNSLIHDVIGIYLNKIQFELEGKKKIIDIDDKDQFWKENYNLFFPIVAEHIDKELAKYKKEMSNISLFKQQEEETLKTNEIKSALTIVPELTEKKRIIDIHMNLAMFLLNTVKERGIDLFFEIEQSKITRMSLLNFYKNEKGTVVDKLRLLLIYLLNSDDNDLKVFEDLLTNCNSDSLVFFKSQRSIIKMMKSKYNFIDSSFNIKNVDIGMLKGVVGNLMSGNLLSDLNYLPITKLTDFLISSKTNSEILQLDPKMLKTSKAPTWNDMEYDEVVVFVAGGGTFLEYNNLADYFKSKYPNLSFTFGSTEILNSGTFLKQLENMSK